MTAMMIAMASIAVKGEWALARGKILHNMSKGYGLRVTKRLIDEAVGYEVYVGIDLRSQCRLPSMRCTKQALT